MKRLSLIIHSPSSKHLILVLFLCLYCLLGLYTELRLIERKPLPEMLHEDFGWHMVGGALGVGAGALLINVPVKRVGGKA